jgi:uncharacterized membrane protein YqiK
MKPKDTVLIAFSVLIVVCTLVWFGMILFVTIPESNKALIDTAAGVFLGSGWTQILNYWFGSSKGSADKSETIASKLNEQ